MDVAFHIGAPCTDGDRLLRSLLRDVDALASRGVAVPGPGRYRKALREAVAAELHGAPGARDGDEALPGATTDATPEASPGAPPGALLDAILDGREAGRVVLSSSTFLALPARVFDGGAFLGGAGARAAALRRLFPGRRVELFLALRNPATFVPAAWAQAKARDLGAWLGGADPRGLRWSGVVRALREAAPDMALTAWCNEDTPLLWGEILARLAGLPPAAALAGRHDLLAAIMAPEGFDRFAAYMAARPGQGPAQERRVAAAFLQRYAIPGEVEEEVDLPGWDAALVEDLTAAYEADAAAVAAMEDVAFLEP